jgi:hypothetical protein
VSIDFPWTASLRINVPGVPRIRLWIPLFLVWLLLLPIALLILPFFCIACLIVQLNPFRAISVFFDILSATRGSVIEVEDPGCIVKIKIN